MKPSDCFDWRLMMFFLHNILSIIEAKGAELFCIKLFYPAKTSEFSLFAIEVTMMVTVGASKYCFPNLVFNPNPRDYINWKG